MVTQTRIIIFLFLLAFSFGACHADGEKKDRVKKNVSGKAKEEKIEGTILIKFCKGLNNDWAREDFLQKFTNCQYEAMVIRKEAILYSQPDSVSKIEILRIGDPVTILMSGNQTVVPDSTVLYPDTDIPVNYYRFWFKVKVRHTVGYIIGDNIAEFAFSDSDSKFKYLVSINSTFKGFYKLHKFDSVKRAIVQTKKILLGPETTVGVVSIVKDHTLKNVKTLLRIETIGETEGAPSESIFIADIGKSLISLPASYTVGDINDSDQVVLYLPFRMTDGTIQLIANMGDIQFPRPLAVPKNVQFPIEDLLIVKEDHEMWDSNDEGDKIGKSYITKKTTYYRWDGTKAVNMK